MNTVWSFPERGIGGDNKYRGNCSPEVYRNLLTFYKPPTVSDYAIGGGTIVDVCKSLNIPMKAATDLRLGRNLLTDEIQEINDFICYHPPYHNIIKYSSGPDDKGMYSSEEVQKRYGYNPADYDLSRCKDWPDFIDKLNYTVMKQYHSLTTGGLMAIIMGDIKKQGKLYSMLTDIIKPGIMKQIIIKTQHNTFSERKTYSNNNFMSIAHEYIMIIQKDHPFLIPVQYTIFEEYDIRDIAPKDATWKDIVAAVMLRQKGKAVSLSEIYESIDGHKRTKLNPHWKEKVRQTLGSYDIFRRVDIGKWMLAA